MKKKITLLAMTAVAGGAMSISGAASAATVATVATNIAACSASAAKPILGGATTDISGTPVTLASSFIKTAFSITCGANTWAYINNAYGSSSTAFAVASTSVKGNQSFRGGASVGNVAVSGACAATGCTSTDATSALSTATANGS